MTEQVSLIPDAGAPDAESTLTIRQRRAHAWFCREFNLRPELSTHPVYRFTDKDSGDPSTWQIKDIESKYLVFKKEEARERAAERRREKKDVVVQVYGGFS